VEFQEDPENTLRCKLVAVVETTGKYIFVNRTGMKVIERSRTDLALELRNGVARVLDDTLLFERALESVIGNLKRLKRGK
jgi:septum formation inhibitor-activating ATPase MinD